MSAKILDAAPNSSHLTFVPLFHSLAGWGLAHAWLVLIKASAPAHLLTAVPALALVALSTLRASPEPDRAWKARGLPSANSRWAAARDVLLLFFVGSAFGLLVVSESVVMLVMTALSVAFVPAAWLPFRTSRPGLPVLITGAGLMSVILPWFGDIGFMTLPLAAWAFWLGACFPLLVKIEQSWRAERAGKARPTPAEAAMNPAARDG